MHPRQRRTRIASMTDHLVPLGAALSALLVAAIAVWALSLRARDTSIVDIFWGPFFLLQAIVYAVTTPTGGWTPREVLVLLLVAVWSIRLATHISGRNAGRGEDYRYAEMRRRAGAGWPLQSLPRVFLLQALLAFVVGLPLYAVMREGPQGWTLLDAAGIGLWLFGFVFEALGDFQLAAFTRDPANRGRTMRSGLWSVTRHPNYFGDAAQWWGLWLIAVAASGWWSVIGPIVMTVLLVRVSGMGMLERTIAARREGYDEYMRTTPGFIPWIKLRR